MFKLRTMQKSSLCDELIYIAQSVIAVMVNDLQMELLCG
jgi:hypothetical protein